jgi:hypothetical protein
LIENDSDNSDAGEENNGEQFSPVLQRRPRRRKSSKKMARGAVDTSYKKKFLFQCDPKEIDRKSKGLH